MRMPGAERFTLWAKYMRYASRIYETLAVRKPELRAAFNALDDYVEANQTAIDAAIAAGTLETLLTNNAAAINAAIPQPARGLLSNAQKRFLARAVIQRYIESEGN